MRYSFEDYVFDTGRRELWRGSTAVAVEPQRIAKGKGRLHAVAAAPSGTAAVENALESCAQAETGCRLHAIGNFRVAEN